MTVKIRNSILLVLIITMMTSCSPQAKKTSTGNQPVKLVYTDWSEAVAITTLAKILLKDEMGIEVHTKLTSVDSAYADVASGNADVFADAWLPKTHARYLKAHPDAFDKLGIIYPGARTGLVVPNYSKFHSISDLKGTDIQIVGIDSTAGVMFQARKAIQQYGLDGVTLKNLSEKEMTSRFSDAYKRMEEIVITGWEPHWLFDRYEVRFLDDPKQVFGDRENIYALGTSGIEQRLPKVVRFFERIQLSGKQINSLIYDMRSEVDPEDGVREWIRKNEYVVNQWIKGLTPDRNKIM
ncbi:MAG TPA: glycine betaine ABC transporter substrate-binding protein [Sunxiuqinia sp.]|nr:glycine betaine ABC transporter substrate-binding protein [Sunxiuqinia sp.]